MTDFGLKRLGTVMEPRPGDQSEVEGVLNPAAIRGRDGQLYLFPRLVGRGNYSRIGIARVLFDAGGDPTGVERLGVALEPEADYELSEHGGGCEDPRISFVEPLEHYMMTYTALSRRGPRVAIAISEDLLHWRRVGLAAFRDYRGMAFDRMDNKDASFFPEMIPNRFGRAAIGLVHRPLFPVARRKGRTSPPGLAATEESIWISYCHLSGKGEVQRLNEFVGHHRLSRRMAPWEQVKIGGGTPPVLCRHGWLMLYHGVHEVSDAGALSEASPARPKKRYSAGAMVLSHEHPNQVVYRTPEPVLVPDGPLELYGTVDNVVFPTGIDRRDDLGTPDRFDVYYGMADHRIGVARLDVPVALPRAEATGPAAQSDKPEGLQTAWLPAPKLGPDEAAVTGEVSAES